MGRKKYTISDFYCKKCGTNMPLPRVKRQREKGHIKDLYCPVCKCIRKFVEIRGFDFKKGEICSQKYKRKNTSIL